MHTLKAFTVRQPWAWALANGYQKVENRRFSTDYRGPVAIHAGASLDGSAIGDAGRLSGIPEKEIRAACSENHHIIAVARLTGVCTDPGTCKCGAGAGAGVYHWKLENVVRLPEPVSSIVHINLWDLPFNVTKQVMEQLTDEQREMLLKPGIGEIGTGLDTDFRAIRDRLLPLPGADTGHRKVLLLGTTGAGKTTVIRQLLGTHPDTERFPSTSTAKTTVAETELVLTDGSVYRAAVTFASREEISAHLRENIGATAVAVFEGRNDAALSTKLLEHQSQRFRFNYILGSPAKSPGTAHDEEFDEYDEFEDDSAEAEASAESPASDSVVEGTAEMLREALESIREWTLSEVKLLRETVEASEDDPRTLDDLIEDELDSRAQRSDLADRLIDVLLQEIDKRFDLLDDGELKLDASRWPVSWTWESTDRAAFLEAITRFSSNQAALFGQLLTPLVNGIRVSGPFRPRWADETPRLVLIDSEGLGHTPGTVATVSTRVRKQLDEVDEILLVDNAEQPMQAAPVSVMTNIASSGNAGKLTFLFTHFDQVKGDNLRNLADRVQHVKASAENVLNSVREELEVAERILRRRLDTDCYFVGGIHKVITDQSKADPPKQKTFTVAQLQKLITALTTEEDPFEAGPSRPVYRRRSIDAAVRNALDEWHAEWRCYFGFEKSDQYSKKHWSTVKAFNRRLAERLADEYKELKPAASLRRHLEFQLYKVVQRPERWTGAPLEDSDLQSQVEVISSAVTSRLQPVSRQLITDEPLPAWRKANDLRGKGSATLRNRYLMEEIYELQAPPLALPAAEDHRLLRTVRQVFDEASEELDFVLN